ncbi:protein NLP6-like isoform X2 [Actinidia eriantha]|uniref:protein NLP6-like isoform X2 n=1 Tax=Actinidia eriantha TaxID=165200 RepID=UPI00258CCE7C|nr:protein NLP6-like isoform X2 [Actinidia eriantha]
MAEPQKYWTKDDFKEHVHKKLNWSRIDFNGIPEDMYPISDTDWDDMDGSFRWIFWSREDDDPDLLMNLPYDNFGFISHAPNNLTLKDKVKLTLRKLLSLVHFDTLVQFWAATTLDGRTLLTTHDQPFGLTRFSNRLCEYRMISKDHTFYVDGRNGEEELGIPGRVYRNKCPECTPNVEYYSVKEHPQRDCALRCGVGQSWTFPVIEHSSQICVGVLEIVGRFFFWSALDRLNAAFQGLGFERFYSCKHHEMQEKYDNKAHKHAFKEMKRVLKLVCKIYKLPSALMWVPCGACTTLLLVEDLCSFSKILTIRDLFDFSMGTFEYHLRNGIGVVDRVFSSLNLLYCSDVTQFSMAEYPLAHLARRCRLRENFAISLRSNYTGNDVYVLEIFMPTSNQDEVSLTLLSKILETMKKEFKTFTLTSGEVLGKELSVEVIEFQNGQKRHYVQTLQVNGSWPSLEPLQNEREIMQVDSSDHQSIDAEQWEIDATHLQELGTKKTSVSISTFKRNCRQYGISRWPPRNMDKVCPPQPSHVDHQEEVPQLNSNLPFNQAAASITHTQPHDTVMQNANTLNVKAKFGNDITIKFQLSLPSRLVELQQQVTKRLNLEEGSYHIKYKDEEDELILIACDDDLQDCILTCRSLGSNAVVLHIDPIRQVYHTTSVTPVSYIDCFPASLRPYIRHVKDVTFDGNCGFRAIAGLMDIGEDGWVQVRIDLLTELNMHVDDYKIMYGGQQRINELTHCLSWCDGYPGMDRWMTMPDMGHLIASCYNVVLYLLSHKQCLTFLPLRSEPIPAAARKEITIGFVNNNHFVEVFLFPDHPVPPVARLWTQYRHQCAEGWYTIYNHRIQHFKKLVDSNVATTDVISLD